MQYILIGHDKPEALPIRQAARPAHLVYWENFGERLIFGGPMLAAEGHSIGSILVIEAEDEAAAARIFGDDPYVPAGVFETYTITPFRHVFTHGKQV